MTTESVGTAKLDIVVDTSQFDTAITAAKRSVSGMSQAAQAEYNKLNGAEKRRIDSLIKQADTLGFTRQQQILYNAALRGTPTNILDELKKKLAGTGDAAAKAGIQLNQYGVSAKQTAAAMRGVPAQLTDIFTSLQGGQAPLTVLLQQGGQLKDMFGGIRPAAAALGGQLLALVNPITLTAAAVGALAVAWKNATDLQHDFQIALATTGNFAGTSVTRLNELVDELNQLSGVTRGGAIEALTAVAASGKIAADQFEQVAATTARIQAATGQSVDVTVAKFADIAKGPVDALLKLNEAEHFLTRAQYARVTALQDEGREQEAVAEATRIYSEHLDDVASRASASLPAISRWWRDIKDDTSQAWGEVETYMNLLDRAIAKQGQLKAGSPQPSAFGALANQSFPLLGLVPQSVRGNAGTLFNMTAKEWLRQKGGADFSGVTVTSESFVSAADIKAREDRKKAQDEWNRWQDQNLSKQQKQQQEEAKIIAAGKKLGLEQSKIDEQVAASRTRFAESMAKSSSKISRGTDPADSIIARIKQQISMNEAQLESEEKLTASDRLQVQVKLELERIGGKLTGGKKTLIEAMLAELAASDELATKHQQEIKAKADLARLTDQLAVSEENRRRSNSADLATIGLGSEAVEMLRRQLDIQRELEDGLDRINRDAQGKTEDALAAEEAALRESIERRLEAERYYQEARAALQSDWVNGARKAYQDYMAMTDDVAARTEEFFSGTFSGLEDAIVGFATGSKDAFGKMLDDMYASAVRFLAQQAIKKLFGGEGEDGGWFSALLGGASGGDSGTNWGSIFDLFKGGDWGFAKGGAFAGGVQAFAKGGAFTNQVVTQPTQFRFAKGIGLMGEAGPEAIMPLKRGRDGRLGVEAGSVAAPASEHNYNITIPVQGNIDMRTKTQVAIEAARQVRLAYRNN